MTTALLIDDDPLQQLLAAKTLGDAGYDVHIAPDGESGLAAVRALKPDVVVCDVVMPGMNGYQVVAAVRADAAISATPFMLLTTMQERAQMRLGMTTGADDYLGKPYRPQELLEAVKALLQRSRTHESAAVAALQDRFADALRSQQEALAFKYEWQLANELSARWSRDTASGQTRIDFTDATLLYANLFGALNLQATNGDIVGKAFQSVRDTLYLFGAVNVSPYGDAVIAVFEQKEGAPLPAFSQGARAALALRSAAAHSIEGSLAQPLSVVLTRGDVTVIPLDDPLHGEGGSAPLPGAALQAASALCAHAVAADWKVAAMADAAEGLPKDVARLGRTAMASGRAVRELLAP